LDFVHYKNKSRFTYITLTLSSFYVIHLTQIGSPCVFQWA